MCCDNTFGIVGYCWCSLKGHGNLSGKNEGVVSICLKGMWKLKGVRRKIVLSAAKSVFSCMISTFHTMKLTLQIMMCTFHCTKSSEEWGSKGVGIGCRLE